MSNYEIANSIVDLDKLRELNHKATLATMKKEGVDAIVVMSEDNVRYLTCSKIYHETDWWQDHNAAVLTVNGQFWACTSTNIYDPELSGWAYFPIPAGTVMPREWAKLCTKALQKLGVNRNAKIGMDQMSFTVASELQKEMPEATWTPILHQLLVQRAVKNHLEVKLLREAARVTDIGLEIGMITSRTPGIRENEVFAKMIAAMTEAGSEVTPHNQETSGGTKSINDFLATDRKFREGELVHLDCGCVIEGYHGDSARTGYCGRNSPSKAIKELYEVMYGCLMTGITKVRPGIRGSEMDAAGRKYLKEMGYPDYPIWGGHGLGVRECEYPSYCSEVDCSNFDLVLKPNMVITYEPRTVKDGVGAAALEDMLLVTESGCEKLTRAAYLNL